MLGVPGVDPVKLTFVHRVAFVLCRVLCVGWIIGGSVMGLNLTSLFMLVKATKAFVALTDRL